MNHKMQFVNIVSEEQESFGRTFRQGENRVLELAFPEEEIKEYELRFLQYCNIQGIIKPIVQRRDNQVVLQVDVSQSRVVNNKEAAGKYIAAIFDLRKRLPEYLLDLSGVVVRPQYSFYFDGEKEWRFLYLPLKDKSATHDLDFFRGFFYEDPQTLLQMEMMKENPALGLADYIDVLTNV